jgi:hypothetical protein
MNPKVLSICEQLKGFSAVNIPVHDAVVAMEESLRRFGPVHRVRFENFHEGLNYLKPLKSFTTRFLVLGLDKWSLLVTDMKDENCYVDAYAISRATRCNAIGVKLRSENREFHLFEAGTKVRQIQSLSDGDRWYYREEGALQSFEDLEECTRNKKRDRLSVQALRRYFQLYTGLLVPDWKTTEFNGVYGLERSAHEVRVPIVLFQTVDDR